MSEKVVDITVRDPASLLSLMDRDISIAEFAYHWLEIQCASIDIIDRAVVLLKQGGPQTFKPIAKWPLSAKVTALSEVSYGVLDEECGLLLEMDSESGTLAAAYPVHINNELTGIVALELKSGDMAALQNLMNQLQWSVGWLERFINRQQLTKYKAETEQSKAAMALLAKVHSQADFVSASMAFVTELSTQLECERVSFGIPHRNTVRVEALSHSAQFGRRMNLIRAISNAMEEAVVAGHEIIFPGKETRLTVPDHEALLEASGCQSLMTLPIYVDEQFYSVLTFERTSEAPFTDSEVSYCRSLSVLCATALEDKRLNRRGVFKFIWDKTKTQLARLLGVDYMGRKLFALGVIALVVFFSLATAEYRVSANTVLEGEIQRVVAAPFKGYIKDAHVKAGDLVMQGQLLADLDDLDLRMERENWLSQRSQYRHQYNQALGKQDRSEVNISKAQMDQASAQLSLADSKLNRSRLLAPFDGTVITGDLSQRLGAYVEQGEVLFEIAPLNAYRVILLVDEKRIADVRDGQEGQLILSSLPKVTFNFTVSQITPITVAEEGGNFFRVEARLEQTNAQEPSLQSTELQQASNDLRPGMEGVGKIVIGEQKLISIWTRGLIEWIQLSLWKWLP